MRSSLTAVLALSATSLFAHEGGPSRFNFRDHVQPLLEKRCGSCHRSGGAAPMTLLDYDEVVPWSRSMMLQILEGNMPPWLPDEGSADFHHTRNLTAAEIDMLIDWSVGELPEGEENTETAPSPPEWSDGEPDSVLRPSQPVILGAEEEERLVCLALSSGLDVPRLASAFEVKPGVRSLVQRATLYRGETCAGRPLVTWLPDQGRRTVPGGRGELVPAGSSLAVEIFYRKSWDDEGAELEDHTEIGVWFASSNESIQSQRVAESSNVFPMAIELLAIFPDPTARDSEEPFLVEAELPSGRVISLLEIKHYEPMWQEKYLLREPLVLPEGTEIRLSRPAAWIDFVPVANAAE